MMKAYRDLEGHIVCYADGITGEVSQKNKKVTTHTTVAIGSIFSVEREGIMTILKRTELMEFEVISYKSIA